jgi:diguanylate cyclase (GGDEF)-like protein/PAS domain S-box-containing protein
MNRQEDSLADDRASGPFLSLFWKAFVFLSVLIIGIGASFAVMNYFHLVHQFRNQLALDRTLRARQLQDLFSRSVTRVQQIGSILTSVSDFPTVLRKRNPRLLQNTASIYANFQYDLDIEQLQLFAPDGRVFWQWGSSPASDEDIQPRQSALATVLKREEPANLLACEPQCALYAYQPILVDGRLAGVFAMKQAIAQLVIEYQSLTGSDLGILMNSSDTAPELTIPQWDVRIAALTHANALTPVLHHLAGVEHKSLDALEAEIHRWKGRSFAFQKIPLRQFVNAEGTAIVISDVSAQLLHINNAARDGVFLAAAGLFVAEVLLLVLIHFPLRHLRRLADTLPLLAQGGYAEVRSRLLAANKRPYRWQDEVMILDDAALRLTHQLESQARAIDRKTEELAAERDFVQGLLDTAQVMILTQSSAGRILTANELTLQLTGFDHRELRGRHFRSLILEVKSVDDFDQIFNELWAGKRQRLQHEAELLCKEGTRRHVMWVHTRLQDHNPDNVAVLSVGLDVTERVEAETRYMWLANHDPLTGLFNRRGFHEELERIYSEVERSQARAALILFDLDHFKDINDTVGHLAGDELLAKLASELKTRIRKADIPSRLGGDEFAILMPHQTSEGAMAFATLLNKRLTSLPISVQQKMFHVTASIGVALIPDHGSNIEEVLANADLAMYQAKNSGRGRIHMFSYSDHARERISDRTYWKQTIQKALLQQRFFFHYQPILAFATGEIPYYEALVRLRGDDGQPIPPGEFLEYAQLTGLIRELDRYVVEEAIRFLRRHRDNHRFTAIHVNLSASALSNRDWTEPLKAAIKSRDIEPERLIFEITETAAIGDFGTAKNIMEELGALGFRFAIDDFGVGFASFSYLRHLPVQFVKIDQSYVSCIADNPRDQAFVSAITTLAHGNDIKVIAEGIENAATLDKVASLGVDLGQGYYIGRPAPFAEESENDGGAAAEQAALSSTR